LVHAVSRSEACCLSSVDRWEITMHAGKLILRMMATFICSIIASVIMYFQSTSGSLSQPIIRFNFPELHLGVGPLLPGPGDPQLGRPSGRPHKGGDSIKCRGTQRPLCCTRFRPPSGRADRTRRHPRLRFSAPPSRKRLLPPTGGCGDMQSSRGARAPLVRQRSELQAAPRCLTPQNSLGTCR
jgi:hypothetical protein